MRGKKGRTEIRGKNKRVVYMKIIKLIKLRKLNIRFEYNKLNV